jgi:transcription antitermination factor NusB
LTSPSPDRRPPRPAGKPGPKRRQSREAALQVLFCQLSRERPIKPTAEEVLFIRLGEELRAAKANLLALADAVQVARANIDWMLEEHFRAAKGMEPGKPPTRAGSANPQPLADVAYLESVRLQSIEALRTALEAIQYENELFGNKGYATRLLECYERHREQIDRAIDSRLVTGWAIHRLLIPDGALLRLGATEIMYFHDVDVPVIINEYVELAKDYGSDEAAPGLINGVLDKLARDYPRPAKA